MHLPKESLSPQFVVDYVTQYTQASDLAVGKRIHKIIQRSSVLVGPLVWDVKKKKKTSQHTPLYVKGFLFFLKIVILMARKTDLYTNLTGSLHQHVE